MKSITLNESSNMVNQNNLRAINSDLGFYPGELIGITGDSGSGKSIFLQHLVCSIILDKPYMAQIGNDIGDETKAPIDHKCLWIDTDGFGITKFTAAINKFFSGNTDPSNKTPFDEKDKSYVFESIRYMDSSPIIDQKEKVNDGNISFEQKTSNFILSLTDKESTEATKNTIIDDCIKAGITMIVVDSLRSITDADENDSRMANVVSMLKEIAEKTKTTVFLIHHSSEKGTSKYRGSTAIKDKLAEMYNITFSDLPGSREITVENIKSRNDNLKNKWIFSSVMFNYVKPQSSRSIIKKPSKANSYDFQLIRFDTAKVSFHISNNEVVGSEEIANKLSWDDDNKNDSRFIFTLLKDEELNLETLSSAKKLQDYLVSNYNYPKTKGLLESKTQREVIDLLNA